MKKFMSALCLLFACVFVVQVHAAILFAGGEDTDLVALDSHNGVHNAPVDTNSTHFRPSFAREALSPSDFGYTLQTPQFAQSSNFWTTAEVWAQYYSGATSGLIAAFLDSGGVRRLLLTENASNNGLVLYSQNATGTQTQLATETALNIPDQTVTRIDIWTNYSCSASGEIQVWIGGVKALDFTGNPCTDSNTSLAQLQLGIPGGFGTKWSEIIVATTSTLSMNLWTLAPNGTGHSIQWTGANPCTSILNTLAINDNSFVFATAPSLLEECTVTNSVPAGNYNALALVMSGRFSVGASGPQHFDFVTRIQNQTPDYTSSNFAPTTSFTNIGNYIQSTNPATSTSWAVTDFTATGFNIGLMSKP